jgi:N-acetylglucosamine kinase-like BadF-type ATPase
LTRRFYLGIDGGGTRAEALVGDAELNVLGRGLGGPCNYHAVGLDRAVDSLSGAVDGALGAAGVPLEQLRGAFAGIAGVDRPADASALRAPLERLLPGVPVEVDNDGIVALAGATGGEHGVVIISGTGSIALGIDAAGRRGRAGGWGYIIGDEGGGYDIGRRALAAVARATDGRGPASALTAALLGHLGLESPGDLYRRLYIDGLERHEIAALVPVVAAAARDGDDVACRLLAAAARELACAAVTVIRDLNLGDAAFPVALCGGAFAAGEPLVRPLWRHIRRAAPAAYLVEARHPPSFGALILARRRHDGQVGKGAAP